MISSGNVTITVSDMDRAVRFYTEVLGLRLAYRFGDHWAAVEVGKGLTIGLHPGRPQGAPVGRPTMSIGLELSGETIREAIERLEARGVVFQGMVNEGKSGSFAGFSDPDGNSLYLAELNWGHVEQGEGKYQETRG
jgi:predicted enzyme related to lactoylglutathione lyase